MVIGPKLLLELSFGKGKLIIAGEQGRNVEGKIIVALVGRFSQTEVTIASSGMRAGVKNFLARANGFWWLNFLDKCF